MTLYIDPPSGWMYGFPKEVPDPRPQNINEWLVSQGYPRELTEQPWFYLRYFGSTEEIKSLDIQK